MSAFLKKGIKPEIPPSINIIAAKPANANAGPAENRLKNLFGRKE